MKPVLRTQVPMTAATRTRSGRVNATSCAISEPIDSPTRATGGLHTFSISSMTSAAWSAMGQGGGASDVVSPTPRAS
jgi:hypothetical protein